VQRGGSSSFLAPVYQPRVRGEGEDKRMRPYLVGTWEVCFNVCTYNFNRKRLKRTQQTRSGLLKKNITEVGSSGGGRIFYQGSCTTNTFISFNEK
jgi:hypothetical protein